MLKEQIRKELKLFGLNSFEHPIYYHCHTGILFEIGVGGVYDNDRTPSKEYIENHVMLHLYDDRGLDIAAHDKNTLMPLYQKLNTWILDYDHEQIDKIFLG